MKTYNENFKKKQIEYALIIKNKANEEINNINKELQLLKLQIKAQKRIIKNMDKDIDHYSD